MEQRISVVTMGVADLERSRRFYADGLGWQLVYSDDTVVFFQMNGFVLALFLWEEMRTESGLDAEQVGVGGIELAHNLRSPEEVDELLERAVAAGGKLLVPAQHKHWGGYAGHFADPDGHPWEIAWNPAWTLDPAGNVYFPT